MTKQFRPLRDWILVRPIGTPAKYGGLAVAPSQLEEPTVGVVLAAGLLAIDGAGISGSPCAGFGVKVGETVQWDRHSGREIIVNGEKLRRLRLEEIAGVWEEVGDGN